MSLQRSIDDSLHVSHRGRRSLAACALLALALLASPIGCCFPDATPVPIEQARSQLDSPAHAFRVLKRALETPQPTDRVLQAFWYTLADATRSQLGSSPGQLFANWQLARRVIRETWRVESFSDLRVTEVELLRALPTGLGSVYAAAARVAVEAPQGAFSTARLQFLFVLELETRIQRDRFPQWRLFYPWEAYQTDAELDLLQQLRQRLDEQSQTSTAVAQRDDRD